MHLCGSDNYQGKGRHVSCGRAIPYLLCSNMNNTSRKTTQSISYNYMMYIQTRAYQSLLIRRQLRTEWDRDGSGMIDVSTASSCGIQHQSALAYGTVRTVCLYLVRYRGVVSTCNHMVAKKLELHMYNLSKVAEGEGASWCSSTAYISLDTGVFPAY